MVDGIVKWFDVKKGYGFLVAPDVEELQDKDIFAHYTKIQMEGFKKIETGEEVSFDVVWSSEGQPQAENIIRQDPPAVPEG